MTQIDDTSTEFLRIQLREKLNDSDLVFPDFANSAVDDGSQLANDPNTITIKSMPFADSVPQREPEMRFGVETSPPAFV